MSGIVKKNLLNELMTKQLKNITPSKRLRYKDLTRIAKNLSSTIFGEDTCSIWDGYVTNVNNEKKGVYINFYFKQKKVALHRLLYSNFVGQIEDDEYLKFSCDNRGKCCNINHLVKYEKKQEYVERETIKEEKKEKVKEVYDKSLFRIVFE